MALNPIANHKQVTDGAAIRYLQRKAAQKQARNQRAIICQAVVRGAYVCTLLLMIEMGVM